MDPKIDAYLRYSEISESLKNYESCSLDIWASFDGRSAIVEVEIELKLPARKSNFITTIKLHRVVGKGRIRLVLRDFVNVTPGFSRIDVSFVDMPMLSYELVAAGLNLHAIPWIEDWIKALVFKALREDVV